jgi:hypothetical protein
LFAGDLQRRLNRTLSNPKDQNPAAIEESAVESIDSAGEGAQEKNLADGNMLNVKEQNK